MESCEMSKGRGHRVVCFMDAVAAFMAHRRLTKRQLSEEANLHINTVTVYAALMESRGWIRPVATAAPAGPQRSARGLKPIVWEWVA